MTIFTLKQDFYFIRHAQTDHNLKRLATGQIDVGLNPTGHKQAQEAYEVMKHFDINPSVIIHSGLKRTLETAQHLNPDEAIPMIVNNSLKEKDGGIWQGMHLDKELPSLQKQYNKNPPGGEPYLEFVERVAFGFHQALQFHAGSNKSPLLVSHGGVFRALLSYYRSQKDLTRIDISIKESRPDNATLYHLAYDESQAVFPFKCTRFYKCSDQGFIQEPHSFV